MNLISLIPAAVIAVPALVGLVAASRQINRIQRLLVDTLATCARLTERPADGGR